MTILEKIKSGLLCILVLAAQVVYCQTAKFVPGEILVKMKPSAKTQKVSLKIQFAANTLKTYPSMDIELWQVQDAANNEAATLQLVAQLNNHPEVEFAEPNYLWQVVQTGNDPNDLMMPQLYGMEKINAPAAWCIGTSSPSVVVAISDTGIDWTHEDLADNIWQNLAEDADGDGKVMQWNGTTWIFDPDDENGIDDDGNGYVDDFIGWDFVNNDNNPMDDHSHGTHCAGTVGAVGNNNKGVVGVCWNTQLAALKFLDSGGYGSTDDATDALNYAVAMGIKISNNSWGGISFSNTLYQAIQQAGNQGHLFVAAAGNWNLDNDSYAHYPSSYDNPNIIAVASTDQNDNLSGFSNYGDTSTDLAAPGSQILSCVPGNNYRKSNGTSMATPHVAGACALLWSEHANRNYLDIKNALMNSVDVLPALNGKCVSNGRLNVLDALVELGSSACEADPPPAPAFCDPVSDKNALIAFYYSTNGDNWNAPWDITQPIDDWYSWRGVTFNDEGCVKSLILGQNNITGTIPPEIGNLSSLEEFVIYQTPIGGEMPPEIGQLTNLKILSLFGLQLIGNIPSEIGNLTQLETLGLYWNLLDGSIPSEIGQLNNLKVLNLSGNDLTGEIPIEIFNLINLQELYLAGSTYLNSEVGLTGSIPKEVGNLLNLKILDLGSNRLTGTIPIEICNLHQLEALSLLYNDLEGDIPITIGQLRNLKVLNLAVNKLSGSIPAELGLLDSLTHLAFQTNQLTGTLPQELGELENLVQWILFNNGLTGCFPSNYSNLCEQLNVILNDDFGNGFDASWEDFCATGAGSCGPLITQVYPGDFNNDGIAEITDLLYWGLANGNTGTVRPNATTNWVGQDCPDWSIETSGVNGKHQDGDGNGIVDANDLQALIDNYGKTHPFKRPNTISSAFEFDITPAEQIPLANEVALNYDISIKDGGTTVAGHGISFNIFFGNLSVETASIDWSNTSFPVQEYIQDFDASSNTLYIALTKTNGTNTPFSNLRITVFVEDFTGGESFEISINNGCVLKANGILSSIGGASLQDTRHGAGINANNIVLSASASHVTCTNGGSASLVKVLGGTPPYCYEWNTGATTDNIGNLSPGMYEVLVCDVNGVSKSTSVEVQGQFIPVFDEDGNQLPCNTYATCPTVIDFENYLPNGSHQADAAIHTKANLSQGFQVELKAGNLIRMTSGFSTRGSQSFKVRVVVCE